MALSEKHRSSIYQTLAPVLGEEEAEALLSQFPARELDEPVTKEFVRAEIAEVRAVLGAEIAEVRVEIAALRSELHERLRQQTVWMAGALIGGMGVASGIASVIR